MAGKKESVLMKCNWNTTFALICKDGGVKRVTIAQGRGGTKKVKNRWCRRFSRHEGSSRTYKTESSLRTRSLPRKMYAKSLIVS